LWSCSPGSLAVNSWRAHKHKTLYASKDCYHPPVRLLIAFILPWLTFFTIGRPVAGIIYLILQLTLIGWIPATIWAVYALNQYTTDRKIEKALGQKDL
jgi:uncharacterized membrane protein YqaE (UPF0057 family)